MSHVPSFEAVLLQIHQGLGGASSYSTDQKRDFARGRRSGEKQVEMFQEIFDDICDRLEFDSRSRSDLLRNLREVGDVNKGLGRGVWTFRADQRQVLWQLLGRLYVPTLARLVANWSPTNPKDLGMPHGRFWYLPDLRTNGSETALHMPVAQAVDWLLDLLGVPLQEFAKRAWTPTSEGRSMSDSVVHSLYNWRNDTVPEANTIAAYFRRS